MPTPYEIYLEGKLMPSPQGCDSDVAIEKMQQGIYLALLSKEPLPDEMRLHMAFAFERLCAGITDDLLAPVRRGGGRQDPIAKHMQAAAVRYVRWCEDEKISDPSPRRTVAEAYGVSARTVGNWLSVWESKKTPIADWYGATEVARFMVIEGSQYHRFISKPKQQRSR